MWIDSSIQNQRQAFIDGLSTELENPSKKMIIFHIRPEFGFIDGRLLITAYTFTGCPHCQTVNMEKSFTKADSDNLPTLDTDMCLWLYDLYVHGMKFFLMAAVTMPLQLSISTPVKLANQITVVLFMSIASLAVYTQIRMAIPCTNLSFSQPNTQRLVEPVKNKVRMSVQRSKMPCFKHNC
ncbi:hypothetical protein NQ317_007685 [Molorchus minor]|uniref:Uncharacterized protein n=1 Tax=Molorchus minor TaxID=1323400 RepID=A0ABQ9JQY9_9CUCU|nr:hypothetical protein NQ317_007685 [Molorchus minor]